MRKNNSYIIYIIQLEENKKYKIEVYKNYDLYTSYIVNKDYYFMLLDAKSTLNDLQKIDNNFAYGNIKQMF